MYPEYVDCTKCPIWSGCWDQWADVPSKRDETKDCPIVKLFEHTHNAGTSSPNL